MLEGYYLVTKKSLSLWLRLIVTFHNLNLVLNVDVRVRIGFEGFVDETLLSLTDYDGKKLNDTLKRLL